MTTDNHNHLKNMLQSVTPNTVFLSHWLEQKGISRDLQQYYKKSAWISTIGAGAFARPQDKLEWYGGVYAIQHQATLPAHPGGLTALSLQGFAHYLRVGGEKVYIFTDTTTRLPKWFLQYDWRQTLDVYSTRFLPSKLSLVEYQTNGFKIYISSPERAILECLYLTPEKMDMVECYHLMEGLLNLRPTEVQTLLEHCNSVKVKRLFLYMADKAGHAWLKYIDKTKINLGSGDRSLIKDGIYIKNYGIVVPKELADL